MRCIGPLLDAMQTGFESPVHRRTRFTARTIFVRAAPSEIRRQLTPEAPVFNLLKPNSRHPANGTTDKLVPPSSLITTVDYTSSTAIETFSSEGDQVSGPFSRRTVNATFGKVAQWLPTEWRSAN